MHFDPMGGADLLTRATLGCERAPFGAVSESGHLAWAGLSSGFWGLTCGVENPAAGSQIQIGHGLILMSVDHALEGGQGVLAAKSRATGSAMTSENEVASGRSTRSG